MPPTAHDDARLFFLASEPTPEARLLPEEARHALQVLRVEVGDVLLGTLGRGRAWPLRVRATGRSSLELEPAGDPVDEPRPGSPGAALPWIELAAPLPQGPRSESMFERLVQLGLSAWTPLASDRVQGPRREVSSGKLARLERTAREGLKQCRRLWLPELRPGTDLASLLERADGPRLLCLDPRAPHGILDVARDWVGAANNADAPLLLLVGPEGGWTDDELARLTAAQVARARLGPHVLRMETAAEAGLACLVALHEAP